MLLLELLDKFLNLRAKKQFLKNVTYKGNIKTLEILRHAKVRSFRGSTPPPKILS